MLGISKTRTCLARRLYPNMVSGGERLSSGYGKIIAESSASVSSQCFDSITIHFLVRCLAPIWKAQVGVGSSGQVTFASGGPPPVKFDPIGFESTDPIMSTPQLQHITTTESNISGSISANHSA
jgi:hypothetical protein